MPVGLAVLVMQAGSISVVATAASVPSLRTISIMAPAVITVIAGSDVPVRRRPRRP
jgi:hypothetical protein